MASLWQAYGRPTLAGHLSWHILFLIGPCQAQARPYLWYWLEPTPATWPSHSTQPTILKALLTKLYTVHYQVLHLLGSIHYQAIVPSIQFSMCYSQNHILHTLALHQVRMPTGPGTTSTQAYSKFSRAYYLKSTPQQTIPPSWIWDHQLWVWSIIQFARHPPVYRRSYLPPSWIWILWVKLILYDLISTSHQTVPPQSPFSLSYS